MDTLKAEFTEFRTLKDLKPVLGLGGPCLSAYIQLSSAPGNPGAKANALLWKETLKSLEPKLEQHGAKGRELLESISDWDDISRRAEPQGRSLAVLRSPEVFQVLWLDEAVPNRAVIGPHFFIRPMLPELTRDGTFYILALSQKNVRMLRCTSRSSEEVAFTPDVSTNFDAYMNSAKPDHVSERGAATGAASGSNKGVTTGTTAVRENRDNRDEYLAHFFRQIDRGVNEALRNQTEPLVLAGVEYELSLYRTLNHYPHLAEEAVVGAPNSLKSGEMHSRALDAMLRCYERKVDEALAEYDHKVGGGASNRMKDIMPAAHDGRILTLLVSDSLETTGAFDQSTYTVKGRETGTPSDEDLVNDAAVQTILHAGQVWVVPNGKMPNGTPMAAIFRF